MTRERSGQELYHKYPCLGCVFWLLFGTSFSPRLMQRWIDELKSFHKWKQVTPLDPIHRLSPCDSFSGPLIFHKKLLYRYDYKNLPFSQSSFFHHDVSLHTLHTL